MKMEKLSLHTTEDEMDFLDNIGYWLGSSAAYEIQPVRVLLGRYLEACENRVNWGDIDRDRIILHAKQRMLEAERHGR